MTFHRIRTTYVKDLKDILRDHRTLVAMIVVPILMYPLLIVGSLQAVSVSTAKISEEPIVMAVKNGDQRGALTHFIQEDAKRLEMEKERAIREARQSGDPEAIAKAEKNAEATKPLLDGRMIEYDGGFDQLVLERQINVGVELLPAKKGGPLSEQWVVKLTYDPEEARSAAAFNRVSQMFERIGARVLDDRLAELRLDKEVITPVVMESKTVSSAGSILGQILPVILVLMTITGAIYPAIDLTAGERERGTLETLMVCPVPVADLIVGKFLVVTTVALMGALLNLASVSATVYFGGFGKLIGTGGGDGIPLRSMALILVCMVPFAVLMSAIMIAVCSYARTFKEAQNYITPVILAVLVPGGFAAMPSSKLAGPMLVTPVANMVLLTRELLLNVPIDPGVIVWVLLSTTLYAVAAVAIAAKVFGSESVVFADSASMKSAFQRNLFKPSAVPTASMALLVVGLLFPVWFYLQSALQSGTDQMLVSVLRTIAAMPIVFALLPVAICLYWKIDVTRTFALRAPSPRFVLAGAVIGLAVWFPVHDLIVFLNRYSGLAAIGGGTIDTGDDLSLVTLVLAFAVVPAVSEEFLFRGFLLSGLRQRLSKWWAIIVVGVVFALFHIALIRLPVTALVGIVLGYLCWQSRSLWPGIIAHVLHNSMGVLMPHFLEQEPAWQKWLGVDNGPLFDSFFPPAVTAVAIVLILGAMLLSRNRAEPAMQFAAQT